MMGKTVQPPSYSITIRLQNRRTTDHRISVLNFSLTDVRDDESLSGYVGRPGCDPGQQHGHSVA